MITEDTVFILGAGARKPYGYPTGKFLRKFICLNFASKYTELNRPVSTRNLEKKTEKAQKFAQTFFASSTPSIDLFLARNAKNEKFSQIGKEAIALFILEAEKKSQFREIMPDAKIGQDWYSYLFGKMTEGLIEPESYKSFGENQITFITFNYDRSLEHFLYESLSNSFKSAPEEEIANQVKNMSNYHRQRRWLEIISPERYPVFNSSLPQI